MKRRLSLAALAALISVAGCGGGDSVDPEADEDAAERAIEAVIEELEDDGFVESPDQDEDEDIEFQSDECEEFGEAFPDDDELPDETAKEETGRFAGGDFDTDGGETTVEASIVFVEDEGVVEDVFELLADERLGDCFIEALEASFEEQSEDEGAATIEGLEFEEIDPPSIGDEGVSFRLDGQIVAFDIDLNVEVHFVRAGRTAMFFAVTSVGEGGPEPDAEDFLELMLEEATAD